LTVVGDASAQMTQRNNYKGNPERAWVRLRFAASDGSTHERELLADTGSPCAIILGYEDLALLSRATAAGVQSNFGALTGGWLELAMPEFGPVFPVLGFGSDHVLKAVQAASADFRGLVGLPLLRQVEYGGDHSAFWLHHRESQS
jgi:hypothetical protein